MDEEQRLVYETQSSELRLSLKKWETDWVKENGGKKPSRDHIKQNPDIARKYKIYHKIRDILSGKTQPSAALKEDKSDSTRSGKRKADDVSLSQTPPKRTRSAQTPLKSRQPAYRPSPAATPSFSRKLFSPAVPTSIGPTPQRDGRVLGLFDLLPAATPSKSTGDLAPNVLQPTSGNTATATVLATPCRHAGSPSRLEASTIKPGRTPMSSTKRNLLDSFMTPLKKRQRQAEGNLGLGNTPLSGSASKQQLFATPAFLRRAPLLPPVHEAHGDGVVTSPQPPIRLPRKPLLRGLSAVVAGLRKLEEDALDDDLDALREMEMEEEEAAKPWSKPSLAKSTAEPQQENERAEQTDVHGENAEIVADSQAAAREHDLEPKQKPQKQQRPVLLGAFDDENLYDSPVEEELDRAGNPLRVFRKKKGQKRTTRLVNMRPSRTRRPALVAKDQDGGSSDGEESGRGGNGHVIPETQYDAPAASHKEEPPHLSSSGSEFGDDSGSEEHESEGGSTEKPIKHKKSKSTNSGNGKESGPSSAARKSGKDKDGKKEGKAVTRAVRKVKATAHANFRRLKLKNSGAKGGPGYGSKFRRRR